MQIETVNQIFSFLELESSSSRKFTPSESFVLFSLFKILPENMRLPRFHRMFNMLHLSMHCTSKICTDVLRSCLFCQNFQRNHTSITMLNHTYMQWYSFLKAEELL